jgi:hypothetical protein
MLAKMRFSWATGARGPTFKMGQWDIPRIFPLHLRQMVCPKPKKPMGHPMQKTQKMGHPTADGPDISKRPPLAQLSGTQKQP